MIRLACTNCREILTIDDAFAGGVCRCQHCGTIQTVPAATAAAANGVVTGGPNLGGGRNGSVYGTAAAEGTGLDELAGAVASSGLSSRRLRQSDRGGTAGRATAPAVAAPPPGRRQNLVPLFAAGGAVIVVLLVVVAYLATRTPTPTLAPVNGGPAPTVAGGGGTTPAPAAGPAFCGTPLAGDSVVYLVDRGGSTQEIFGALRDATLKSIASLGPRRNFQLIFWDNGTTPAAYPPTGTTYAVAGNVDDARRETDDVFAAGSSDVQPVLPLALAQHPDTIVIATAKGGDLGDQWVKDVMAARGTSPVKIDTFNLTGPDDGGADSPALKAVAERTGGTYADVPRAALRAAGE